MPGDNTGMTSKKREVCFVCNKSFNPDEVDMEAHTIECFEEQAQKVAKEPPKPAPKAAAPKKEEPKKVDEPKKEAVPAKKEEPKAAAAPAPKTEAKTAPKAEAKPAAKAEPSGKEEKKETKLTRSSSVPKAAAKKFEDKETGTDAAANLRRVKAWLASPEHNVYKFSLAKSNDSTVTLRAPMIYNSEDADGDGEGEGSLFSLTLDAPHSISAVSASTEELENDSFQFCFGDEKRSVYEVLEYANTWCSKHEDWNPDRQDSEGSWDSTEPDPVGVTATEETKEEESKTLRRVKSYTVLTRGDMETLQNDMIERVVSRLGVSSSSAATLLRVANWNEEKLNKEYKNNQAELLKKAGIALCLTSFVQPPEHPDSKSTCNVCIEEFVNTETFAMRCGHRFCIGCWKAFLSSEIQNGSASGANCLNSTCPGYKCKESVGMEVFEMMVDEADFAKYKQMLLLSFVDNNEAMVWCPGPKCGRAVSGSRRKKTIKCVCTYKFCWSCKEEAHAPASCDEASQWRARDKGSQNLDAKYLMNETKPCPHCKVRTKKEGGCMYLVCSSCKKPWCWQCGKSDHHVWECNRPAYDTSATNDGNDMNKYLWFFERYFNHNESLKFSQKQREQTQAKMRELVSEGMHFKRVEFLNQAVELVIECRRVLKYTYTHAFYIKDPHERTLFEYRQSDLEKFTEKLNQLTESSLEELQKNRLAVLDWTRALERYLDGMELG